MEGIPKIEGSLSQRYSLSLYTGFHRQIYDIWYNLVEDNLTRLNLTTAMVEQYKALLEILTDRDRRSTASSKTIAMNDYDTERNSYISLVQFTVSAKLRSTDPEIRKAAQELKIVLDVYKGIQYKGDDAKTSSIIGLYEDCKNDENIGYTEKLGLTDLLEALKESNDSFNANKTQRHTTAMEKSKEISTKDLRKQMDELCDDMFTLVYASAMTGGDSQSVGITTIDKINAVVRRFKTSYKQSEAQKAAHKKTEGNKGESKPTTDPMEPEE